MEFFVKRSLVLLVLVWSLFANPALTSPLTTTVFAGQRRVAQQPRDTSRTSGPQGTAAAPARLPQAQLDNRILANGLEVIVLEDHSVPLITIEAAVRNGSFTEPPELNGLSHLYEHMFFKTNRAVANQEEYLRNIGQLGIAYNASTREEVVNYFFTTTSQNLRTAMQFMRDSIRYPLFDEREFERERQVVIGEIDRNESNPFYYLDKEMKERLFYEFPSRKQALGNRQTVSTATTAMMRLIQSRFQRALVDSGVTTGAAIGYYTQRNVGPISIIVQTTPEKAHAAIKAIYNEVAHFNDKDYYTDEQLESAKALLEADDLYSREKLSEYSHTLSFWWSSTGLEYFRRYLGRLRATSL